MSIRRIMMACSNYWQSPLQVGSHHLARGFAKAGWKVGFLSDPISPWHLGAVGSDLIRDRIMAYRSGGNWDMNGAVWHYVPCALFPPRNGVLFKSEWVHRSWLSLSWPDPVKKLQDRGFLDVDLFYCDSPLHACWLNRIKYKKSIYRIPDHHAGFSKATLASKKLEKELIRTVNLVVYTAKSLEPYVQSLNPQKMHFLPNGVDAEHFKNYGEDPPLEYQRIPKPIALYVGVIDSWFDFDLLKLSSEALPEISFVIIGPGKVPSHQFSHRPNVHFLGSRPYGEIPAYLRHAQVGLIPFNVKGFLSLIPYVNPLKLYEYMACGLPVVSMRWEELERINSPALLCSTPREFVTGIEMALSRNWGTTLEVFAAEHGWNRQVENLLNYSEGGGMGGA